MKLLIILSVLVCILKGINADIYELTASDDIISPPSNATNQHVSQSEISENKISLPKSLSASLTVLRSNPKILLPTTDTDSYKQAVLTSIQDASSTQSVAAASNQDNVKIKPYSVTHKSSKIHTKLAKNAKQLKQPKESHQGQSSNRHERFNDKDFEFVPSATAPEVIYRAGDNIKLDDTPYHDILDNEDPTYAASTIQTDKRVDGYHYGIPRNSFIH